MLKRRNKSGLKPSLYSDLSLEDQNEIKALMIEYNGSCLDPPFLEPSQFYHAVIRGVNIE